jgi:hypothetical protein
MPSQLPTPTTTPTTTPQQKSSPLRNEIKDTTSPSEDSKVTGASRGQPTDGDLKTQTTSSFPKTSTIKAAFKTEESAANFLAAHGGSNGLTKAVHDIGSLLDVLISSRQIYLTAQQQVNKAVAELARFTTAREYPLDILHNLESLDPQGPYRATYKSSTPSVRHSTPPTGPTPNDSSTNTSPRVRLPKSPSLETVHTSRRSGNTLSTSRQTPQHDGIRPSLSRYRHTICRRCHSVAHRDFDCPDYECHWCNSTSPGHYAKFCPENPFAGIARRDLAPNALEMVDYQHRIPTCHSKPVRSELANLPSPSLTTTGIRSGSERHSSTGSTPVTTTTTTGPTYRPVLNTKRRTLSPPVRDRRYGKLATGTLTPHHHISGRISPNNKGPRHTSRYGRSFGGLEDEDFNFDYDDEAMYNIDGEGRLL